MDRIATAIGGIQSALTARRYQYQPVGGVTTRSHLLDPLDAVLAPKNRKKLNMTLAVMGSALGASILISMRYPSSHPSSHHSAMTSHSHLMVRDSDDSSLSADFNGIYMATPQLWGQYSPQFSVPSDISADIPDKCTLTYAQVLSRHGARNPTAKKSAEYNATIQRIKSDSTRFGEDLKFLKDFQYTLGADQLTDFGRNELIASGKNFFNRYQSLTNETMVPFVRASGQDRVVESGQKWVEGYYSARESFGLPTPASAREQMVVLVEDDTCNNTMKNDRCTSFEDGKYSEIGDEAKSAWLSTWIGNVTERLNLNMPGANITNDETLSLMDLCPYNTVATVNETISDFCTLFSIGEWLNYDYYYTLDKYYGHGDGNPMAATTGVGYVNELIARLNNSAVIDNTSVNHTLDDSAETFPLGLPMYADFSHDNDMSAIFSALRFYEDAEKLPTDKRVNPEDAEGFSAAWVVPFAARLYIEKMSCESDDEERVRFILNDRVIKLNGCDVDKHGACKLSKWIDSMKFAQSGGNWTECFAEM